MTEEEVVDAWNEHLGATNKAAAQYKHVAVEVPLGSPQVEFVRAPASGCLGEACCDARFTTTSTTCP